MRKITAAATVLLLLILTVYSKGGHMREIDYSEDFSSPKEKELISAIMDGDIVTLRRLAAEGGNLNAVGAYENTPLRTALMLGQKSAVKALLQLGVNPNLKTPEGVAAADVVVTFQRDPAFLELLFEYGLDPDLTSENVPLIFFAVSEGLWRQYNMLLAKGADINSRNENGSSLLLDLVMQMEYDRAKDLLLKGADFRVKSMHGLNVLDELVDYQRRFCSDPDLPDCHKRAELLRMLQERGASVPPGLPCM
ncbi:hypothetical protein KP004_12220 [Geomonas oryzisoli]|uniref:Ankyrin repeat domain-containing protein n=1 Tax=Geomonas oryzisoli TaxID=2847992 RepID=A0ABX8J162_9BACT|nr:hypothetical protein [Geomonas oryzisoli]QWV91990.1 hypothetical protein KP004_12220 [Geomonas oryzisoli]